MGPWPAGPPPRSLPSPSPLHSSGQTDHICFIVIDRTFLYYANKSLSMKMSTKIVHYCSEINSSGTHRRDYKVLASGYGQHVHTATGSTVIKVIRQKTAY